MRRLATLMRSKSVFIDNCIRGPKKKGQVEAKIQSNDIINIFKDREDPQPRDISEYPLFVKEMSLGGDSIHEYTIATQQNIKWMMPNRPAYKTFINGIKRQRFKAMREYIQLDQLPVDKNQKFQVYERNALYDLFNKTKQQIEEENKAAEAAQALQQDDQDQF